MSKGRVLSGMRPTGRLHLGHLFGALENWSRLQEEYECYFFVADWHALTTEYEETKGIRENIREMVLDMLAAGIDTSKATLFLQSRLHEHAELHLLLSMITPVPWLERNPTYKEQQQELTTKDLSTYGFLGYPVLMASDILIYKANYVPVGIDQVPHLEVTREIARRFNHLYRGVFVEPEALLTEFPKIPGTDGRKMSKSYDNAVFLTEEPDQIYKKVRMMVTDPARVRRNDPGHPEVCTVFAVHQVFTSAEVAKIEADCRAAQVGCTDCKKLLAASISEELAARPQVTAEVLADGADRARAVAKETLKEVRTRMNICLTR